MGEAGIPEPSGGRGESSHGKATAPPGAGKEAQDSAMQAALVTLERTVLVAGGSRSLTGVSRIKTERRKERTWRQAETDLLWLPVKGKRGGKVTGAGGVKRGFRGFFKVGENKNLLEC